MEVQQQVETYLNTAHNSKKTLRDLLTLKPSFWREKVPLASCMAEQGQ